MTAPKRPGPASPRVAGILRASLPMLDDLRLRLSQSFEAVAAGELPSEEWRDTYDLYTKALERQANAWVKLRDAARKIAANMSAHELDANIAKELEDYMVKSLPEDRIRHVLEARAGGPVEVIPARRVVAEPAPEADPWDAADPETKH